MKTIYSKLISGLAFAGLALATTGCNLDETNPNAFDANGFWQKETDFSGNITAMMNQWRTTFIPFLPFSAGELRTDYYYPYGLDGTGIRQTEVTLNQYSEAITQFANYGNIYGLISNCNTYLYYDQMRGETILPEAERNYILGMVYGMRAFCNFQIHKMWGTGPIRDDAMVIEGIYDEVQLQKTQATPEAFLENIYSDITKSLNHFQAAGSYKNAIYAANGGQCYWNKATTEMLAGEVHLWAAKVSTMTSTGAGSHVATGAPDIAAAKQYFLNVVNNYGYELVPGYIAAVNTNGAANTERIFGFFYSKTEATTSWYNYIQYDPTVGGSPGNFWSCVQDDGITPSPNAARLTYSYLSGAANVNTRGPRTEYFQQRMGGQNQYQSRNAYYYQFDPQDNRTEIFQPIYMLTPEEAENNIQNIENFDFDNHYLAGCYIFKFRGEVNAGSNTRVGSTYQTVYRLALAYAYLAEIANFEGNNADVEKYINIIRERAYGDNWDEATFGYKAGSFLENEVAILQEKTKEFFQEGQRWFDLRRMTAVKGGAEEDHLCFRPEGCIGWGLDLAAHPEWREIATSYETRDKNLIETDTPLLDYSVKAHMVMWPLDANLLNNDTTLRQTPGYEGKKHW